MFKRNKMKFTAEIINIITLKVKRSFHGEVLERNRLKSQGGTHREILERKTNKNRSWILNTITHFKSAWNCQIKNSLINFLQYRREGKISSVFKLLLKFLATIFLNILQDFFSAFCNSHNLKEIKKDTAPLILCILEKSSLFIGGRKGTTSNCSGWEQEDSTTARRNSQPKKSIAVRSFISLF